MKKIIKQKKWIAAVCSLAMAFTCVFASFTVCADTVSADSSVITCEADGSDSADDTSAIQASLDEAAALGGATVQIPAGTYYISNTLTIYSDTTLILDDDAVIVRTNGENVMLTSESDETTGGYGQASNITVQGGTWDGNVTDTTVLSCLMYFAHASNITLKDFSIGNACSRHIVIMAGIDIATVSNVSFYGFVEYTGSDTSEYYLEDGSTGEVNEISAYRTMEALHLDVISEDGSEKSALPLDGTTNRDITVTGCTFSGLMSGVGNHYPSDDSLVSTGLTVTDNTFEDLAYTCINVFNQDDFTVSGNTAANVSELVRSVNSNGVISNNTGICDAIDSSNIDVSEELELSAIRITDGDSVTVSGNTVSGGLKGIAVFDTEYALISGNSVISPYDSGISFNNASGEISGNTVSSAGGVGISVYESDETIVENNIVSDASDKGIAVEESSDVSVISSTVSNAGSVGISINWSSDVAITDNSITYSTEDGIYAYESDSVSVSYNTVTSPGEEGIGIDATTDALVSGNTVTETGSAGITLKLGSTGTITYNTVSDPGGIGIYIYESVNSSASKTTIAYNEVTNAGERGIQVEYSTYVDINSNIVSDSTAQGIRCINSSSNISISNNVVTSSGQHGIIIDGGGLSITLTKNYSVSSSSVDISILSGTGSADTGSSDTGTSDTDSSDSDTAEEETTASADTSSDSDSSDTAEVGDSSNLIIWCMLLAAAAAVMFASLVYAKKRKAGR